MAQGQGRPGDLGELLSIVRAAALVHGAHPQCPGGNEPIGQMDTPKRSEKFRTKSGLFAVFLRSPGGKNLRLWWIHGRCAADERPKCGRPVIVPAGCDGQNAKKRIFCGQKAVVGEGTRQILPTLSRQPDTFRSSFDPRCVSSDKKRSHRRQFKRAAYHLLQTFIAAI